MEKKEETQVEQTTAAETQDTKATVEDTKDTQGHEEESGETRGRGGRGRGRGGRGRGGRGGPRGGRGGDRGGDRGRGAFRGSRGGKPEGEVHERRGNPECTVFVNNLKYSTSWQFLKDVMREFGEVVRVDIFKDGMGRSKGFGTVEFATKEDAQNCIEKANDLDVDGRKILVREEIAREQREKGQSQVSVQKKETAKVSGEAKPGFGIYVGNLPFSVTSEQLKNAFQSYGKILSCDIPVNKNNLSKGWGLIRFETHEQALEAIKDMNDAKFNDRQVQVREDRE